MAPEKLNNDTGEKWRTIPNVKFTAKSFFFFYKNNSLMVSENYCGK